MAEVERDLRKECPNSAPGSEIAKTFPAQKLYQHLGYAITQRPAEVLLKRRRWAVDA